MAQGRAKASILCKWLFFALKKKIRHVSTDKPHKNTPKNIPSDLEILL